MTSNTATDTENNNSATWEELLGSKKWSGLIEPELNLSLREFILRCGDMCQATYDAFNSTVESPNCGNSDFEMDNFLSGVMLKEASRYQLVSFLYATAGVGSEVDNNLFLHPRAESQWDRESNWFGYVAVTNDKVSSAMDHREVYITWRGTILTEKWGSSMFDANPVPASPLFSSRSSAHNSLSGGFHWWGKPEPTVHEGWLKIYTSENSHSNYAKSSARTQLHKAIGEIKKKYKGENLSIIVTGHSLGGALATLSGFDLAENAVVGSDVPISVITFSCPQVGNETFRDHVLSLPNLNILQVVNIRDTVPMMPDRMLSIYAPIATATLEIDTKVSPYLLSRNAADFHNLQGNLHVVAGWNGMGKPFEMKVRRSLALVNKSSGFLRPDLKIPEGWWADSNKRYDVAKDEWIFDSPPPAADPVILSI